MTADVHAAPHVLACKSFIMGTCNLLIVGLPAGWRLQRGPFPPEVDHWRDFGGVTWAQVGRGSYQAIGPALPPVPERRRADRTGPAQPAAPHDTGRSSLVSAVLRITISRWRPDDDRRRGVLTPAPARGVNDRLNAGLGLHRVTASGQSTLGGHPGTWALGEVTQGFGPWRRSVPALTLASACPATGRLVHVVAECPSRPALEAMLEANRACWTCH